MKQRFFLAILMLLSIPLWAQPSVVVNDEKLLYVGMTLIELNEKFGVPKTVAIIRGNEPWQDDVVFQYTEGDFYIFRDRVWQVLLTSACGVSNRDRKAAVLLTLGYTAEDNGDHILLPISGKNWPLMLRINFNNSGQVSAIFIYRPDF